MTIFEDFIKYENKIIKKINSKKKKFKKCKQNCVRTFKNKEYPIDIKHIMKNTCIKNYCNPKCRGFYAFKNKCEKKMFYRTIKNGFSKNISKKNKLRLKKMNVMSNCTGRTLL